MTPTRQKHTTTASGHCWGVCGVDTNHPWCVRLFQGQWRNAKICDFRRNTGTEGSPFIAVTTVTHLAFLVQAEPTKKPTAVDTAPRHRVRTTPSAAYFWESPSNSAAIKTKISPIGAKEPKLWPFEEGQSISSLESRQAWTRPEPQSAWFCYLQVVISMGVPNFRIFLHSGCGPI